VTEVKAEPGPVNALNLPPVLFEDSERFVDLASLEKDAGSTVVDFETDLHVGYRRGAMPSRSPLYPRAITAATGGPAKATLRSV